MRIKHIPMILLATVALVLGTALPSHAAGAPFNLWGSNRASGMPTNLPGDKTQCTVNDSRDLAHPAYGCMEEVGDHFYVKDISGDGHSAMVYFEVAGKNGACVNSFGNGTVARCDLGTIIPEDRTVCIWAGWIEMAAGPSQFKYYIAPYSKHCFVNNNSIG